MQYCPLLFADYTNVTCDSVTDNDVASCGKHEADITHQLLCHALSQDKPSVFLQVYLTTCGFI
jgi:hypothetical protein